MVFDLLRGAGQSLLALPYAERRTLLEQLDLDRVGVQIPAAFLDTPGEIVMAAAAGQGLEGVVAKRLTSVYAPGRRTRAWIKAPIRHTTGVIIAGWVPATGTAEVVGSLLLGAHTPAGELTYVGDGGTGLTDTARRLLHEQLRPLHRDRPPFPGRQSRAR